MVAWLKKNLGINRTVAALSVARMADALGNSLLFILIPLYVAKLPAEYLKFDKTFLVGLLLSIYGLISAFLQPVMGAFSDRIGKRKILIQIGLGLIGIGTLGFILAQNFLDLLLLRSLQGIAVAITIPASMALMSSFTKKETRGSAMGVYSTLRMVGFATGPLLGGFLQVHFGFDTAFYVGSGFIFLSMFLVQIWIKDAKVSGEKNSVKFKAFDRSLLNPGIVTAAMSAFLMACAFSLVTALENEFNAKLNINAVEFSIAFSSLMVSRLLFQVPLGKFSDRIGRKPLIIIGLILMAPATILLGEASSVSQLIIIRLFQGIAAAAIAAPAFAIAADLTKTGGEGRQMSLITMGFGLGIAAGPLFAGTLAVIFFELPFFTTGILLLIGAWIVYNYMPETVLGERVLFKSKHS